MSNDTFSIGIGAPLSGVAAALGREMLHGVELAVDEHNASRHADSKPVSLIARDDEGTPARGIAVARELAADDRILGVVGHYNSDVTIAAAAIYDAAGLAMITPIASNPSLTDGGRAHIFRLTNRDDATARAIARHLHHIAGKRRAAVIETCTTYGHSMAESFVRAFTDAGGRVVTRAEVNEGDRDFAPLVRALPADIDLVFYGGSFEGAPLLRALREAGIMHLFATGDGCWDVENFLRPARDVVAVGEGVLVLSASLPLDHPGAPSEVAMRYHARFGPIGNYALNAYDAARALLAAIDIDTPTRDKVVATLRRGGLDGVAFPGRLDWDVKGDNLAAVTVLHVAQPDRFEPIAIIGRGDRLVVGLDDALPPPMQMGNPAGDDFRGYEVDLLHEIAARLDVELRYRRAPWSQVIDDLARGAVDFICSAATVLDDPPAKAIFSRPYLSTALAIVCRSNHSVSRVGDAATLAVRHATTAERYVRGAGGHVALVSESNEELYDALVNRRVDAVVDDLPIGRAFARMRPGLRAARLPDTDGAYALILRRGDEERRARIDAILLELETNGTLSRLRERWDLADRAYRASGA
jgi:branched-chain amino acid transport system substrate-binding protein